MWPTMRVAIGSYGKELIMKAFYRIARTRGVPVNIYDIWIIFGGVP